MSCAAQGTCEQCQKIHRCGWCDDGTGSGSGYCMEGTSKGPISLQLNNDNLAIPSQNKSAERVQFNSNQNKHLTDITNRIINLESLFSKNGVDNILGSYPDNKPNKILNFQSRATCKADKWFFTHCPICQCNGHSTCKPGTSICKACSHDTEGEHCEECRSGFYGNPINGGKCLPCKCFNNQSVPCDKQSGRCFCTTKGITGFHCEKCDESNHYYHYYFGSPKESTCYYNLSIDFQYTFNMSKTDDRHFNKINFMNMPHRPDLDVDFTITCSNKALFNISFGSCWF